MAGAWTDAELEACVVAYLQISKAQLQGQPVNKSAVRERVLAGPLSGRTKGAYEYRMQNISSVLASAGLGWVDGFRPAENVGPGVAARLRALLADRGYSVLLDGSGPEPTADPDELERRTRHARRGAWGLRPVGQRAPERVVRSVDAFVRDPVVRALVLDRAGGHCELCAAPAPFVDRHGDPFLEVHHLKTLAEGGSDTTQNAAAVCPNCHRRLHHGQNADADRERLYRRVSALVPE